MYRESLSGPWICSWKCGFKSFDLDEIIEHERYEH